MRSIARSLLAVALLAGAAHAQEAQKPNTSLHLAALQGDTRAIARHIQSRSDLDLKNEYGSTPLIVAATFGRTEVALQLIEAGADLNVKNNDGATALHTAAFFCHPDIVSALLASGADSQLKDRSGKTALDGVTGPFERVKPVYDIIAQSFGSLGLELDYDHIEQTRPLIADMLRAAN